jgi:hypothetical protein
MVKEAMVFEWMELSRKSQHDVRIIYFIFRNGTLMLLARCMLVYTIHSASLKCEGWRKILLEMLSMLSFNVCIVVFVAT